MSGAPSRSSRVTTVASALSRHRRELAAFVRARVAPVDVDDVLQIASVRAVERAHLLDDPARVLPWLYRIVRNVLIDEGRASASRSRRFPLVDEPPEVAEIAAEPPCRCSASLAGELPAGYRALLMLVDFGDGSLAEAAERLGITRNNATVRLHRARAALRKKLREHCGVSSARECRDCRCTYDGCCG